MTSRMTPDSTVTAGHARADVTPSTIFQHLSTEHGAVLELMQRLARSTDDRDSRDEQFREIRRQLLGHARAEEWEFYGPLERHAAARGLVATALAQHREIEDLLEELVAVDKDTRRWGELFGRLQQAVQAHVALEEGELFAVARGALSRERARDMHTRYRAVEELEKLSL